MIKSFIGQAEIIKLVFRFEHPFVISQPILNTRKSIPDPPDQWLLQNVNIHSA